MLEGKNVNLRVMEKEDLPLFAEWVNKPEFIGEYNPLRQLSRTEIDKGYEKSSFEQGSSLLRRKMGAKSVMYGTSPRCILQ